MKDFVLPEAKLVHGGSLGDASYTIRILNDMIDESEYEELYLQLSFTDPNQGEFSTTTNSNTIIGGTPSDQITLRVRLRDSRDDVPPVIETNYTGTTLDVSKNLDAFDLEFELRRPQDTNVVTASGLNVDIGYTVNTGESTIGANGYTLANGTLRIDAGDTLARLPISLDSSNINSW